LGSVAGAILILLAVASQADARRQITSQQFLASPGAQAFKAQDFAGAVEGFRALLATYPNDPLILRYVGIALDRAGRYEEAVEAFGEALGAAPGDVSILFFLGVSQYNLGDFGGAETSFAEVAAKAPDTDYGARAREFLAAIKANVTQITAPAAQKRWNAYAQLGLQYDDNVAAAPDSVDDRDSWRSFEYLNLGYALVNDGEWLLRAEASGYFSQHWENDFDSLDIQFLEAAAALNHATMLGDISVVPSFRYGLTGTFLDSDEFVVGHRFTLAADLGWNSSLKTRVFYRAAIDDYEVDGFLPSVTSRDGTTHEAGIKQFVLFDTFERESRVFLGYEYQNRDADGSNHESDKHTVSAGVTLALPEDFVLDIAGRLAWDDFDEFQGYIDPNDTNSISSRETDIYGGSIALSRPITDNLSASLSYSYHDEDSNIPLLSYDRNLVTFVLGYSL
jgi:tetratricopeptide (TPR) repeat protein